MLKFKIILNFFPETYLNTIARCCLNHDISILIRHLEHFLKLKIIDLISLISSILNVKKVRNADLCRFLGY